MSSNLSRREYSGLNSSFVSQDFHPNFYQNKDFLQHKQVYSLEQCLSFQWRPAADQISSEYAHAQCQRFFRTEYQFLIIHLDFAHFQFAINFLRLYLVPEFNFDFYDNFYPMDETRRNLPPHRAAHRLRSVSQPDRRPRHRYPPFAHSDWSFIFTNYFYWRLLCAVTSSCNLDHLMMISMKTNFHSCYFVIIVMIFLNKQSFPPLFHLK